MTNTLKTIDNLLIKILDQVLDNRGDNFEYELANEIRIMILKNLTKFLTEIEKRINELKKYLCHNFDQDKLLTDPRADKLNEMLDKLDNVLDYFWEYYKW